MILVGLGHTRTGFAALVGSLVLVAYSRADLAWVGQWEASAQLVCNALPLALPGFILAGAADARTVMGSRTAVPVARPGWRHLVVLGALSCVWPGCCIVVTQAVIFASDLAATPVNVPPLPILLSPYAWTATFISVGWLLGACCRLLVVAPLAILLGFLMPVLLASRPDTTAALFTPIDDGAVDVPIVLDVGTVWGQLVILTLLTLTVGCLLAVSARAVSTSNRWHVAVVGGLLALAAVAVAGVGDASRRVELDDQSGPRACLDKVCVWSDHKALLDPVHATWLHFQDALTSRGIAVPSAVVENGLQAPPDALEFGFGGVRATEEDIVLGLSAELVDRLYCPRGESARPTREVALRQEWLLLQAGYRSRSTVSPELSAKLSGRSVSAQAAWWANVEDVDCA